MASSSLRQSVKQDSSGQSEVQVLLVDDEAALSRCLIRGLRYAGARFHIHTSSTPEAALALAAKYKPEVCVLDLSIEPKRGPASGIELISKLLVLDPSTRIIVLTAFDAKNFGIPALHAGASSFNQKPVRVQHLLALINDAAECSSIKRRFLKLQHSSQQKNNLGLSSLSSSMLAVLEAASFAAYNPQPLLLTGETGTGKGLLARLVHRRQSKGPFVRCQPGLSGHDLANSELFGHEKGAFTGAISSRVGLVELANGGTLFIDEIDSLSIDSQVMLLEVLQEKTFFRLGSNKKLRSDFRLICATNADPKKLLSSGKMRADFFHRIAHLQLHLPPLRKRAEDIPVLAREFLDETCQQNNLAVYSFTPSSLARLISYSWSGNIRQLKACVESACWLASYRKKKVIGSREIELSQSSVETSQATFNEQVKTFKLRLIRNTLERNGNNQTKAARELGMERSSLRRIISK